MKNGLTGLTETKLQKRVIEFTGNMERSTSIRTSFAGGDIDQQWVA